MVIKICRGSELEVINFLIIKDALNLLTTKAKWFSLKDIIFTKQNNFNKFLSQIDISKTKNDDSNELTTNFKIFFNLREEQYRLCQKITAKLNQSLKVVDLDVNLGIIILITMIEVIAQKYGINREEFNDNIPFYQKLKSEFKKCLHNDIKEGEVDNFFSSIGDIFMETTFSGAKGKFINFILNFSPIKYHNEKLREMVSDLYDFRSLSLHRGDIISIPSKDQVYSYNFPIKKGKIKKVNTDGFIHEKIVRIPPFDFLLSYFLQILKIFLNYLNSVKDDEEDKKKYKESDFFRKTELKTSLKGRGYMQAGKRFKFEDIYQTVDYISLIHIYDQFEQKIKPLFASEKYLECIRECDKYISYPTFSMNFKDFRQCVYFKAFSLFSLKHIEDFLKIFDDYNIVLNKETFPLYRLKIDAFKTIGEVNRAIDLEKQLNKIKK